MSKNSVCHYLFLVCLFLGLGSALPLHAGADDLASIEESIARFKGRYGIPILYQDLATANSDIHFALVSKEEYGQLSDYLALFEEEINKYSPGFFKAGNIHAIGLVKQLFFKGRTAQALFSGSDRVMLFDTRRFNENKPMQRHNIHHEIYHMMAMQSPGYTLLKDEAWASLNAKDFTYGKQKKSPRETNPVNPTAPNLPGFVTYYGMESIEEDKAEVFACLMQEKHKKLIEEWQKEDEALRKKIEAIKAFAARYDPEMDEKYWNK